MSAQTKAGVDVLAVMDAMFGQVWRDHGNQGGERIERLLDQAENARAAVDELIEAATAHRNGEYHDPEVESHADYRWRRRKERERLDAALDRVQGGA